MGTYIARVHKALGLSVAFSKFLLISFHQITPGKKTSQAAMFSEWQSKGYMVTLLAVLSMLGLPQEASGQPQKSTGSRPEFGALASLPIQCGISYGNFKIESLVSCRNYGNWPYLCSISSCHWGSMRDTPKSHPIKNFQFDGCTGARDGKPSGKITPDALQAENKAGTMVVKTTKNNLPASYICSWKSPTDLNNSRPWCSKCYYIDWTQPSWTTLVVVK